MSLSVSIIVNVRNGEKFIAHCIETIKNQTYDAYEVIFVDNNSSDNTRNLIFDYGKTSGIFDKIRVISVDKTLSLAAARNVGLDSITSDLVAFLDIDDTWHPSKLLHQVDAIIECDADMCATNFILDNQRNNSKNIYINKKINSNNLGTDILKDFYIHFSSFVVKKSAILESKVRFEEEYEIIEDLD
jgi:glycosyltransferase involved in cell wall biosynthesis